MMAVRLGIIDASVGEDVFGGALRLLLTRLCRLGLSFVSAGVVLLWLELDVAMGRLVLRGDLLLGLCGRGARRGLLAMLLLLLLLLLLCCCLCFSWQRQTGPELWASPPLPPPDEEEAPPLRAAAVSLLA
jgi:hypothetical protein